VSRFEDFFAELDDAWGERVSAPLHLRIIGASALSLQTDYDRGTKDSDVLETKDIPDDTKSRLLELGGPGTPVAKRHRVYVHFVVEALPLLPQAPLFHRLRFEKALGYLELHALDVVDVVVSKLKRFEPRDIADIDAMIERGLVRHDALIERFRAAIDWCSLGAYADDIPAHIEHLHQIERDSFVMPESAIEVPSWLDR